MKRGDIIRVGDHFIWNSADSSRRPYKYVLSALSIRPHDGTLTVLFVNIETGFRFADPIIIQKEDYWWTKQTHAYGFNASLTYGFNASLIIDRYPKAECLEKTRFITVQEGQSKLPI